MQLDKCRIILTGASSGIGLELLQQLQQYDVQIMAVARNIKGITGVGQKVNPFSCDVSRPENIDQLFSEALRIMGGVDLFIANAGFAYYEKLEKPDWEHIESIYRTNVFSPLYSLEKLEELHPDGKYRMVITASAMGKLSLPGYALYSSTKSALDAFADGYRFEIDQPQQITLVYPIATATNFFHNAADNTPVPWPTQSAGQVAKAIIRGIEKDRPSIYPSLVFRIIMQLNRFLPFIFPLYLLPQQNIFRAFWKSKSS